MVARDYRTVDGREPRDVCKLCGAVIEHRDRGTHTTWHRSLDALHARLAVVEGNVQDALPPF